MRQKRRATLLRCHGARCTARHAFRSAARRFLDRTTKIGQPEIRTQAPAPPKHVITRLRRASERCTRRHGVRAARCDGCVLLQRLCLEPPKRYARCGLTPRVAARSAWRAWSTRSAHHRCAARPAVAPSASKTHRIPRPKSLRFLRLMPARAVPFAGKMDPYATVTVGSRSYRTKANDSARLAALQCTRWRFQRLTAARCHRRRHQPGVERALCLRCRTQRHVHDGGGFRHGAHGQ